MYGFYMYELKIVLNAGMVLVNGLVGQNYTMRGYLSELIFSSDSKYQVVRAKLTLPPTGRHLPIMVAIDKSDHH